MFQRGIEKTFVDGAFFYGRICRVKSFATNWKSSPWEKELFFETKCEVGHFPVVRVYGVGQPYSKFLLLTSHEARSRIASIFKRKYLPSFRLQDEKVELFVSDVNSHLRQRQEHERLKTIIARIDSYEPVVSYELSPTLISLGRSSQIWHGIGRLASGAC